MTLLRSSVTAGVGYVLNYSRSVVDLTLQFHQVGVGRDDGVAAGEFSPVFYKKYVNRVRK